ncbi:hypothetical protein M8C21_011961 [Ambrosia artemisiifolia]|uniref:SAM-dependent methyltransferase TRM5/TYW2-type domain-containing protein n=1 Tax=Ambrosia artemisiifolia TaxID=4212 RepID=A0AAD5GEU2_AMBAR|nr:hypothetical protein M8C21_011961 [Ambrosia artemisiifolia]
MFTNHLLRPPPSLPTPLSLLFKPSTVVSIHRLTVVSTRRITVASISFTPDDTPPYGPSLSKGHIPQQQQHNNNNNNNLFDENLFTRVYNISAVRVSADRCYSLESQIRGHLLNWPRIRNIGRVYGDEIDAEMQKYFNFNNNNNDNDNDDERLESLNRRIYGKAEGDGERLNPVLYREKLVKSFNSRGYEKFRNLAKLSRPKRKGKAKTETERGEVRDGKGNGCYLVEEVVGEEREGEEEDLSRLIGDAAGYRLGKWKGSTRLLLLDERYADKSYDELPEAVKACLKGSVFELVRCKLTLYYSYWQMNEVLEALLPEHMIVPSSFETVGHIIHLNLRDEHLPYKNLIAKVVLDKNKPKIQTVVNKIDAINNDFRTMQLEVLAGNHSLVTRLVENGLHFHVDLASVCQDSIILELKAVNGEAKASNLLYTE